MTIEEIEALISPARLRELHAAAIAAHGGLAGERVATCVEGVVGNAVSNCLYAAAESGSDLDPLCFLAHLMRGLNGGHCFNDGNKRITWMVVDEVLLQLGLEVVAEQDEAALFVRTIATERLTPQAIIEWFLDGRIGARGPA